MRKGGVDMQIAVVLFLALFSTISKTEAVKNKLDLQGDGKSLDIDLPFNYYPRPSSPPKFTVISQGAYAEHIRGKTQPSTWVIGPLDPCIGIMVGNPEGFLAFHLHWSNNLEDMGEKIEMHFPKEKESPFVRIFTVKNDDQTWKERQDNFSYGVDTHREVVLRIKDYLVNSGILRERITAQMYSPPQSLVDLGLYAYARTWIAMNSEEICTDLGRAASTSKSSPKDPIPLFSVDPCVEDILELKSEYFGPKDIWGENLPLETEEQRRASSEKCKFSNLPPDFKRIIYYNKLKQMEKTLYQSYFNLDDPSILFTFTPGQEFRGIRPFMQVNANAK